MLCSIKNRDDLESLNDLAPLQSQVKAPRLQDKLGKQYFHEDMKKVLKCVTKTFKDATEDVTKTTMVASEENNEAIAILNNKILQVLNDTAILASFFRLFYLKSLTRNILSNFN